MTQENIDQIGQTETQFEQGYADRWRDVPYGMMPANHSSEAGKKPTLSYRATTR